MLKTMISACVFAMLALGAATNAQTSATSRPPADQPVRSLVFSPALVGDWKSVPEEIQLTTAFDEAVWGPNAKSVRTVELQIQPSGEGLLKVTKRVVDAKGRKVPASTSVEEAKVTIGGSRDTISTRVEHDVTVQSAARTYPEDPVSRWDLAGLRVQIVTFTDADHDTLEVRVETPEGRGSFWETLRRDSRNTSRRSSAGSSASLSADRPGILR
jgi:hypothetical protein